MTLWIDAQLSPALARWLGLTFDVSAIANLKLILTKTFPSALEFLSRDEMLVEIS